ncbi:hypothetical protein RclHR1_05970002 [Rhizophagus clarus]|uniref:Uncharacterized protein n=1 Tax=Rhizophagus clarus TaxID=94130 RepID=A0A2Z6S279_9GLOM|nr:hypothetical protein RclHR1_05970002 [Rhizophagus clarus]
MSQINLCDNRFLIYIQISSKISLLFLSYKLFWYVSHNLTSLFLLFLCCVFFRLSYSPIIPNTYLFLCFSFLLPIVKPTQKTHSRYRRATWCRKRRKYDDDDIKLQKVWDALKNAPVKNFDDNHDDPFLEFSEEVSYLFGKDDQSNNITTLFVRESYLHISKIILERTNIRRFFITGNPGIGKTFFGYYLLYKLAQQNKTVVYHKRNKPPILFSNDDVYSISEDNIYTFKDYLGNENVWYIVDGREPTDYNAKTILVSSPQKVNYGAFYKIGTTIQYMPVWSWEETDTCRKELFPQLSQKAVRELYDRWGGIPRFTLFYALNESQQRLLDKAINSVNASIFKFVGESTDDNSAIHKIVHIYTNLPEKETTGVEEEEEIVEVEDNPSSAVTEIEEEEEIIEIASSSTVTKPDKGKGIAGKNSEPVPFYTMSTLKFASDYVSEKVMSILTLHYRDELLNFVRASSAITDYSTLRVPASCFGLNNPKLQIPRREKLVFRNIEEIQPNMYCIPIQQNNASFDAYVPPDTFFQMTIAESHPIVRSGVEKYINQDDNFEIKFYFVLPKELYDSYEEQDLHTVKRTVLKRKPPWVARFRQYAVEFDMKL